MESAVGGPPPIEGAVFQLDIRSSVTEPVALAAPFVNWNTKVSGAETTAYASNGSQEREPIRAREAARRRVF
jgi:hypothetical protein